MYVWIGSQSDQHEHEYARRVSDIFDLNDIFCLLLQVESIEVYDCFRWPKR